MIAVACFLLYLAIVKQFEPLLLLPIAFGMLLANLPAAGMMSHPSFTFFADQEAALAGAQNLGKDITDVTMRLNPATGEMGYALHTMSVVVSSKELHSKRADVMADICKAVDPENIFVEENLALIAVVGRGMVKAKGTAARIFTALANSGVNIRMIDQGSSELNIIVGVDSNDYITALRAIYNEFVK